MEAATQYLIKAIDRERARNKLSGEQLSAVVGISPSYWSLLKAGKRRLTPNLAVLFMQKLPELTPAVTAFIMRQGNNGHGEKTTPKSGV